MYLGRSTQFEGYGNPVKFFHLTAAVLLVSSTEPKAFSYAAQGQVYFSFGVAKFKVVSSLVRGLHKLHICVMVICMYCKHNGI